MSDGNCPGNLICLSDNKCGCPPEFERQLDYCSSESLPTHFRLYDFLTFDLFAERSQKCSTTNPCLDNQECIFGGKGGSGFCVCPRGFRLSTNGFCEGIAL